MENKKIKKLFTKSEVDEFLKKLTEKSENSLSEQKKRIDDLREENSVLKKQNDEIESKNKNLSKALSELTLSLKKVKTEREIISSNQNQKLKSFAFRWKNYLNELSRNRANIVDENLSLTFASEIDELVDQISESEYFRSNGKESKIPFESKKTIDAKKWLNKEYKESLELPDYTFTYESEVKYNDIMQKLKTEMVFRAELTKPSELGFNIEEAINPTDSLGKIIDDLL